MYMHMTMYVDTYAYIYLYHIYIIQSIQGTKGLHHLGSIQGKTFIVVSKAFPCPHIMKSMENIHGLRRNRENCLSLECYILYDNYRS